MAKRKSQSDHDKMVLYGADFLSSKRANVRADLEGWPKPAEMYGYIPDITATGIIVEVETDDSIFDQHTEDQWNAFSRFAGERSLEFWVMVPAINEPDAKRRMELLGITNGRVWGYTG